jgi:uncharacterized membrane protein YoaK (UPF0700 family)
MVAMTADREHGPLPGFLLGLTVVTGLVDAFSFLNLGHVFVANMTGNVIFLGLALAGIGDNSAISSLLALAAFTVGATVAGRVATHDRPHRGHLLAAGAVAQSCFVVAAAVITVAAPAFTTSTRLTVIAVLAVAMGAQNAVVRRLAVPDLTTTVLTRTVAGLVADASAPDVRWRRLGSVATMLAGALAGGLLLQHAFRSSPLWLAALLLAIFAVTVHHLAGRAGAQTWR